MYYDLSQLVINPAFYTFNILLIGLFMAAEILAAGAGQPFTPKKISFMTMT